MARFGGDSLDLPATAEIAATNVALPMGPDLDDDAIGHVVDACAVAVPA
jgi:dTDP-4-amino-4,6-dideoxygalactose transaminase